MAQVVYAGQAIANLERAFEFLHDDPAVAEAAAIAITTAVDALALHPLIGRPVRGDLRELVISFGRTGYLALSTVFCPYATKYASSRSATNERSTTYLEKRDASEAYAPGSSGVAPEQRQSVASRSTRARHTVRRLPKRRAIVLTLLTAALLVATRTIAAELAAGHPESAPCPRTFQLVAPEDWRCAEEPSPQCTVCRNRSRHYTEVLVHCVDDGTDERRSLPPGATLSICGGRAL